MQDWLFFLTGIAVATLSILISIYFRTGRRINVYFQSTWIIDKIFSNDRNLDISYKKRKIVGLLHHRLYIWNSGNKSIKRSDIDEKIPLIIKLSSHSNIHSLDIVKTSDTFDFFLNDCDDGKIWDFNHIDVGRGVIADF